MTIEAYDYDARTSSKQHPEATRTINALYKLAGEIQRSTLVANPGKLRLTVDFTRREIAATITSHFFISDRD